MRNRWMDGAAIALIVIGVLVYGFNLGGWLMDQDEGTYLYQAWRISQGEVPYRDFLTPQLPLFLYSGAALFRTVGVADVPARAMMVLVTGLTAVLVYVTTRGAFGRGIALLGLTAFLAHDTVFEVARQFRPESFMLLFGVAATWLVQRRLPGDHREQRTEGGVLYRAGYWPLALAGALFGLALLSKLFAGFMVAGCALFGVWLLWTRRLTWREGLIRALWVGVPLAVVSGLVFGYFYLQSSNLPADVLGHHLRQGRDLTPWEVAGKGIEFLWAYFWTYPLFLSLALLGAVRAWRSLTPARAIYLAQLPTVLAFLVLSRQLWNRHMMYLLPALAPLFAFGLAGLAGLRVKPAENWRAVVTAGPIGMFWNAALRLLPAVPAPAPAGARVGEPVPLRPDPPFGPNPQPGRAVRRSSGVSRPASAGRSVEGGRALAALGLVLVFAPLLGNDLAMARRVDAGTPAFARLVAETTHPGDIVLTDYSGLNFYARRRSTYSGASLSMGAAMSGQISGHDLVRQIQADDVQLVTIQNDDGRLIYLLDYLYFREWVQTHFHYDGTVERTGETHRVYRPGPPTLDPLSVDFGGAVRLAGFSIEQTRVEPGRSLYLVLGWQAQRKLERDYVAFVHLVDGHGTTWTSHDQPLDDDVGNPTSAWQPGSGSAATNLKGYAVRLLTGAPPGTYEVRVGLYEKGNQSARLPVGGTPDGATEFTLARIEVPKPSLPWWGYPLPLMQVPYPSDVDMGQAVRLIGYTLPVTATRPGDGLGVTLFWKTEGEVKSDFRVRLRLRDARGAIVGESLSSPSVPEYPPTAWGGAAIVTGNYQVIVDPAAPAGPADLLVNLVTPDGKTLRRDDWRIARASIGELPRVFAVPPIENLQRAELGGYARLLGYDLKAEPPEGCRLGLPSSNPQPPTSTPQPLGTSPCTLQLTLYWQGIKPTPTGYNVFTHLIDADNGIYGQHDKTPLDGARPTTSWIDGEVLVDRYAIRVKPDTPQGTYRLEVGLYESASFARLPVTDAQGQPQGDRVLLDNAVEVVR